MGTLDCWLLFIPTSLLTDLSGVGVAAHIGTGGQATEQHRPDVLVIARHSYKPDGNFIARRIDALFDELDHMTFGTVSAFLARRAQCPLLIIPTQEG